MVFYFSGTGNSEYVARRIARAIGEVAIPIAGEFHKTDNSFRYTLSPRETLGFVFPVYAWAPPKMMSDFISLLSIESKAPYIFCVNTCGEEEGLSTETVQQLLEQKGLHLSSAMSIKMPSNYIIGHDVYSQPLERDMLMQADRKLDWFETILTKRQTGIKRGLPGVLPNLKSRIVNPLFYTYAINTDKFYADANCDACGLCERVCPVHTIRVGDKPEWGRECTQCLACINRCPQKAIQYGKITQNRGRYVHPSLK